MKIGIINYGMGNIGSVCNAVEYLGYDVVDLKSAKDLKKSDKIILPGVGAFKEGMARLNENDWVEALRSECVKNGKPLLGICLGMQLLAEESYEFGESKGLGFIAGNVDKIKFNDNQWYRLPHIGWNTVNVEKKESKLYLNMNQEVDMYFVHSYVFEPIDRSVISGTCDYGIKFVASIEKDNIFATQFHPEKSHKSGLNLLNNFIEHGGE